MKVLMACALLLLPVWHASGQTSSFAGHSVTSSAVALPVALNAPKVKFPKGGPLGRYVVSVAFTVDEQGVPRHPHIVQSDNQYFDFSAMVTALQWRFKPAMRDGQPVATPLTLSLAFEKQRHFNGWNEQPSQ
jgi:TonB family protein